MRYTFRLLCIYALCATCLGCNNFLGDLDFESSCERAGLDCDDGNPCTRDRCVNYIDLFGTGTSGPRCEPEPTNDGIGCSFAGISGVCQGGLCGAEGLCDGVVCEDEDKCTDDACAWNGECTFAPVVCDDNNACTEDRCDAATGMCDFTTPSEEGRWCIANASSYVEVGSCEAGVCVGPCDPEFDEEAACPVEFVLGPLVCCPGNENCVPDCAPEL